jgi:hypothetical protein
MGDWQPEVIGKIVDRETEKYQTISDNEKEEGKRE